MSNDRLQPSTHRYLNAIPEEWAEAILENLACGDLIDEGPIAQERPSSRAGAFNYPTGALPARREATRQKQEVLELWQNTRRMGE